MEKLYHVVDISRKIKYIPHSWYLIDIVLDKSITTDRILSLDASVGKITTTSDDAETKALTWTPNNGDGYIDSNVELSFEPHNRYYEHYDGKAIWVKELTFHYDC